MESLQGFMQTFATAIAGTLTLIGYVPGAEQSSKAIFGMKMMMGVIPTVYGNEVKLSKHISNIF